MRVLTTGTNGQPGHELIDDIFSRGELDIIDPTAVEREEPSVSIKEPRNL